MTYFDDVTKSWDRIEPFSDMWYEIPWETGKRVPVPKPSWHGTVLPVQTSAAPAPHTDGSAHSWSAASAREKAATGLPRYT